MWISKTEYEAFKKAKKRADYDVEMYEKLYNSAINEALRYKKLYNDLKEKVPLKLFEVEIYLSILEPIIYHIKTFSPEEAKECAIKMFTDKNKDFSASDIVMIIAKPICAK